MSECRKHPGVWAIRQIHDEGEKQGQYGLWCQACQAWCDECEEKKQSKLDVIRPTTTVG